MEIYLLTFCQFVSWNRIALHVTLKDKRVIISKGNTIILEDKLRMNVYVGRRKHKLNYRFGINFQLNTKLTQSIQTIET